MNDGDRALYKHVRATWGFAQEKEQEFWRNQLEERAREKLAELKEKVVVPEIIRWVEGSKRCSFTVATSTILQIGCAAVGTVYFFPKTAKRFAVEPLADFFKAHFPTYIDPEVNLTRGVGEQLPFGEETIDFVLLDNVLDHCIDPSGVVAQVHRVLRSRGVVYVLLHFTEGLGKPFQKTLQFLQLPFDEAHPHHFDLRCSKRLLSPPFHIVAERVDFWKNRLHGLRRGLKDTVKNIFRKRELELVCIK